MPQLWPWIAWLRVALLAGMLCPSAARFLLVGDVCLFIAPSPRPLLRRCRRCSARDDPLVLRLLQWQSDFVVPTTLLLPAPPTPLARRLEALRVFVGSIGVVEFLLLFVAWIMVRVLGQIAGTERRARRLVQCADDYLAVLVRRERFAEACGLADRTLVRISTNTMLARHVEPASLLRLKTRRRQLLSQSLLQTKLHRAPEDDDLRETASVSTLSDTECEGSGATSEGIQISLERENRPTGEDCPQLPPRHRPARVGIPTLRLAGQREPFFPR